MSGLAQVGFVVVTFGHRGGSPMRDKWYHTFGYNNLRDYPLADDKCGIEQLADRFLLSINPRWVFSGIPVEVSCLLRHCVLIPISTRRLFRQREIMTIIFITNGGETHHGVREVKSFEKKTVKDSITGKDTTDFRGEDQVRDENPDEYRAGEEFERVFDAGDGGRG